MSQFLVIIRGAPASGKTTIAKQLRNYQKKIAWLKVDNFKDFFSDDAQPTEQKNVDEAALATLQYLLDNQFSVVMEKIFFDPFIIPLAVKEAQKRDIPVHVFQLQTSLTTLQERDRNRPGIKEGCRKPLGDDVIQKIYEQLENTPYPGAIRLNTEELTLEKCVTQIRQTINHNA